MIGQEAPWPADRALPACCSGVRSRRSGRGGAGSGASQVDDEQRGMKGALAGYWDLRRHLGRRRIGKDCVLADACAQDFPDGQRWEYSQHGARRRTAAHAALWWWNGRSRATPRVGAVCQPSRAQVDAAGVEVLEHAAEALERRPGGRLQTTPPRARISDWPVDPPPLLPR